MNVKIIEIKKSKEYPRTEKEIEIFLRIFEGLCRFHAPSKNGYGGVYEMIDDVYQIYGHLMKEEV